MKKRICKLCGEEYSPTSSHQSCCNREIEVPCEICGKLYKKKCTTANQRHTCSEECNVEFQKIRRAENARNKKKICNWCGKEFTASHARVVYCEGPHYKKCAICGKEFEIDVKNHRERQTCSNECFVKLQLSHRDLQAEYEKQKQVLLEKYGVENSALIPGAMEKAKQTNRAKYGVDWYTQTDEYRERTKKISLEKYNVEHWLSSEEVINKRRKTVLQKYKSTNVLTSEYGRQKIKEANESNGGRTAAQLHIKDIESWNNFKKDPEDYIKSNFNTEVTVAEIAHKLGVSEISINGYLNDSIKTNYIKRNLSKMETDVMLSLQEISLDLVVHSHIRKLLGGYEIDLYLPEYEIGIECNPTWTHNSTLADRWTGETKDKFYHMHKTDVADKVGIFLIHLFGYEWKRNKDAVVSYFARLLDKSKIKLASEDTSVVCLSELEGKDFFEKNHILGCIRDKITTCLGLVYKNELVCVMSFCILDQIWQKENEYELQGFCCKIDVDVVGGEKKLFNYFIEHYEPNLVEFKLDRSHFPKNYLDDLGFISIRNTSPQYFWVNIKKDNYLNIHDEYLYELNEFLDDKDVDFNKSIDEIMEEQGYVKVYDSGLTYKFWISENYSEKQTKSFTNIID